MKTGLLACGFVLKTRTPCKEVVAIKSANSNAATNMPPRLDQTEASLLYSYPDVSGVNFSLLW